MGAPKRAAPAHHHAACPTRDKAREALRVRRSVQGDVMVQVDRAGRQPFGRARDRHIRLLPPQNERSIGRFVQFGGVAFQRRGFALARPQLRDEGDRIALAYGGAGERPILLDEVDRAPITAFAIEEVGGDRCLVVLVHMCRQIGHADEADPRHCTAQRIDQRGGQATSRGGQHAGAAWDRSFQRGHASRDLGEARGEPTRDRDPNIGPFGD